MARASPKAKRAAPPFALIATVFAGVLVLVAGLLIGLAFRDPAKGVTGGPLAAAIGVAALLYRYRTGDSQALSVWLCTRNDCIANIAVVGAGAGVWWSGTPWPDIAVAAIIACLALSSAVRVIRQARREWARSPVPSGFPAE